MADLGDYRDEYNNERFSKLEQKIDSHQQINNMKLTQILEQTKKTNGSVGRHNDRLRLLEDRMITCPITEVKAKQDKFEQETETIRFFFRNPKLLKSSLVGSVVLSVSAILLFIFQILNYL